MTDPRPIRCSNPACLVAQGGVCAEGHEPLESCPSYGVSLSEGAGDESDSIGVADVEHSTAHAELISLNSGEVLGTEAVDEFLRQRAARFVSIVGDRDSGKTTLIACIYDSLLKGPFAGFSFSGSRTLMAFERSSHYARIDSGRNTPNTPHTSRAEGLHFFHLALTNADGRCDLMLSDRAGEVYREARDDSTRVGNLIEVAKSDVAVILLDGARVTKAVERAGALQSVRQTLRAFLDGGALGASSTVQVVTTKIDLLEMADGGKAVAGIIEGFRSRLQSDFGSRLGSLTFAEIAARDPKGSMPIGFGVDALLSIWVKSSKSLGTEITRQGITLDREFDRLLRRPPLKTRV